MSDIEDIKLMQKAARNPDLRRKLLSSLKRQRLYSLTSISVIIPTVILALRSGYIRNGGHFLILGTVGAFLHIWYISSQIKYLSDLERNNNKN